MKQHRQHRQQGHSTSETPAVCLLGCPSSIASTAQDVACLLTECSHQWITCKQQHSHNHAVRRHETAPTTQATGDTRGNQSRQEVFCSSCRGGTARTLQWRHHSSISLHNDGSRKQLSKAWSPKRCLAPWQNITSSNSPRAHQPP